MFEEAHYLIKTNQVSFGQLPNFQGLLYFKITTCINNVKNSVIEKEDNLNMVDFSFSKIENTFTMLAGEERMMTEGKGE